MIKLYYKNLYHKGATMVQVEFLSIFEKAKLAYKLKLNSIFGNINTCYSNTKPRTIKHENYIL